MQVAEDGRFLGMAGAEADERAPLGAPAPQLPSRPTPSAPAAPRPEPPAAADSARLAQLEAQVRALTETVQALTAALAGAGVVPDAPAPSTAAAEESKAAPEQSKAPAAESKAGGGGKYSTSYPDTVDTPQTPPTDTRAARPAAVGGGGEALPDDLRQALQALNFRGQRPLAELAAAYGREPGRVGGWIRHIGQHRAEYQQPAGFLLQSVVREGLALPAGAAPASNGHGAGAAGPCPTCGGRGAVVLNLPPDDPDHGRSIPCPRCGAQRSGGDRQPQ